MTAEDDWDELPAGDAALVAVWPLVRGDRVMLHEEACGLFEGNEDCDCEAIRVDGPSVLA